MEQIMMEMQEKENERVQLQSEVTDVRTELEVKQKELLEAQAMPKVFHVQENDQDETRDDLHEASKRNIINKYLLLILNRGDIL